MDDKPEVAVIMLNELKDLPGRYIQYVSVMTAEEAVTAYVRKYKQRPVVIYYYRVPGYAFYAIPAPGTEIQI